MTTRGDRRRLTEKMAERRLESPPRDLRHQPVGRFRKWNMTCECSVCQIVKADDIMLRRIKDEREKSLQ